MHALSHLPRTFHPHSHWLKFEPSPHSTHDHLHGHPRERSVFDLTFSSLYFTAFLMSFFLSPFFYLSDEQQPELNQKIMENLWNSANGGEGTLRRPLPLHRL